MPLQVITIRFLFLMKSSWTSNQPTQTHGGYGSTTNWPEGATDQQPTDPRGLRINNQLTRGGYGSTTNWPEGATDQQPTDPRGYGSTTNWPEGATDQQPTDPRGLWINNQLTRGGYGSTTNWPEGATDQQPTDPRGLRHLCLLQTAADRTKWPRAEKTFFKFNLNLMTSRCDEVYY